MTDPRYDAILNVAVASGQHSEQNNFSELLIVEIQVPQQPEDPVVPVPKVAAPTKRLIPRFASQRLRIQSAIASPTRCTTNGRYRGT